MLETAGTLDNLRTAAGRSSIAYRGPAFMDCDVYTWVEAASLETARLPSETLRAAIDTDHRPGRGGSGRRRVPELL